MRTLLAILFATAMAHGKALDSPIVQTHWEVRTSQGLDALCALNVLSGDPYYVAQYRQDSSLFAEARYAAAREASRRLRTAIKDERGGIISAFLTLVFSGGPSGTIDEILEQARAPEGLRQSYRESQFWNADSWDLFELVLPDVILALEGLRAAGFADDLARRMATVGGGNPRADLLARLQPYDVIGALRHLTGRTLQEGRIEVVLLYYSRPHGIRVQGSRFLTNVGYPLSVVLRNAIHEPLHPPVDFRRPGMAALVQHLGRDSLIARAVRLHDRSFGYNTLEGYVDENLTQALDQLAGERLGIATPAGSRWRTADGGMHVLAAALYDLLRESGFAESGGRIDEWLLRVHREGALAPEQIDRHARAVVGDSVVAQWLR